MVKFHVMREAESKIVDGPEIGEEVKTFLGGRAIPFYLDMDGRLRIILALGRSGVTKFVGGGIEGYKEGEIGQERAACREALEEMGIFPFGYEVLGLFDERPSGGSEKEIVSRGNIYRNLFIAFYLTDEARSKMKPDDDVVEFIDLPAEEVFDKLSYESTRNVWIDFVWPLLADRLKN